MSSLFTATFLFGSRLFDLSRYIRHCIVLLMGGAAIWIVFSGEEFHLKYQTEPLPHEFFYRVCFVVLGVSMIGLSIWGLWLGRP